jgi:DNA repair exonuclease SbcCD ATPase subunit
MQINCIIHLSDIHIRLGNVETSRYKEYVTQFDRLFASLSVHPSIINNTTTIVITGDIFHHKNKIEPNSLELALYLIKGLSKLAPLHIIRGNHDYRQDLPHDRDTITSIMSYQIPNVFYLDTVGNHTFHNVAFGLVPIQDTLLHGATSGVMTDLPPFPSPLHSAQYNVALFHGTISGCQLKDVVTRHGYPIDWIKGYDAILLGDIHIQQIHRAEHVDFKSDNDQYIQLTNAYTYNTTSPWGYPGSLIQQNFGESIMHHGYVVWNLADKTIQTYHLNNTYGFITLRINDNVDNMEICHDNVYIPFKNVIAQPWFPNHLRVRVSGTNICHDTHQNVVTMLQAYNKTIISIQSQKVTNNAQCKDVTSHNTLHNTSDILKINSIDTLVDYLDNVITSSDQTFDPIWQKWIKHPETLIISLNNIPDILTKKISDKSDKMHKDAVKYLEDFDKHAMRKTFDSTLHLNRLEFNWLFNFKNNNVYDFDKCQHSIAAIIAQNASGKSNLLEIICIALFGTGYPSRHSKNHTNSMISDKKPDGVMASTSITFTINDTKYKLVRCMRRHGDGGGILFHKIILYNVDRHGELILHQGSNAVSAWIETNIGTIEMYLMTAMLSQNGDADFFSLDVKVQRDLLDKVLSLSHINSLKNLLKDASKYYKHVYDIIEAYYDGISTKKPADPLITAELDLASTSLIEHRQIADTLYTQWNSISEQRLISFIPEKDLLRADNIRSTLSSYTATYDLSNLQSIIAKHRVYIDKYKSILLELHTFSDLNMPTSQINKSQCTPDALDVMYRQIKQMRSDLDIHPCAKSSDIYQDFISISKSIQDFEARQTFETDYKNNAQCAMLSTPSDLAQTIYDFETWNRIKQAELSDVHLHNTDELTAKLQLHEQIIKEYPAKIKNLTTQLTRLRKTLSIKRKECDVMSEQRPNKPSKSQEWLQHMQQQIMSRGNLESALQREQTYRVAIDTIPILCTKAQSTHNEISEINLYLQDCINMPFNADCHACRQQPWRTKYDAYLIRLPELHATYQQYITELDNVCSVDDVTIDIHNYSDHLTKLRQMFSDVQIYIASIHEYDQCIVQTAEYAQWDELYKSKIAERDECELAINKHDKTLKDHNNKLHNAQIDKNNVETKLDMISRKKVDFEAYQNEYTSRSIIAQHCKQHLEHSWLISLSNYRTHISDYIAMLNYAINASNAVCNLNAMRIKCEEKRITLSDELRIITEVSDVWQQWCDWKAERDAVTSLDLKIRELQTKLDGCVSSTLDTFEMTRTLNDIRRKGKAIEFLSDKFGGYRQWLYTQHICPMICDRVNTILSTICDDRPLYLEGEWFDKIDTVSWWARDGTSRFPIEKASGFQRFIIGIAMRISFYKSGICRGNYDQLFIDEGFTACDGDNLSKIPDFLRKLLDIFNSICLVTHLEDLKSCVDHHIPINKDASGLSQISYGDALHNADDQTTHKKAARSSKITVHKL